MSMTLKMTSASGVPAGAYQGEFLGVEPVEANIEKGYGVAIKWAWKITAGDCIGQIASRITGRKPSPKNACGQMLTAIVGRALSDGEDIDLTTYVGRKYMVVVGIGQSGGTRVETVASAE